MKKIIYALALAAFLLAPAFADVEIVASFYPMYIMAKNVADKVPGVTVSNMTTATTGCLHDYTVTPDDMKKLAGAQVFIANGAGMESFLDKVIAQYPKIKIATLSEGITLIKGGGDEGDNPHVWVSVSDAMAQVKNLGKALAQYDPANAKAYKKNTAAYVAKLESLRKRMHQALAPFKGESIITFHEAFPYFAKEFSLKIAAVVEREPGSEPSAKELADTIKLIRKHKAKALFSEPQYPSSAANTIARETGLKVYVLDPAVTGPYDNDAYINTMERNLQVLKTALK